MEDKDLIKENRWKKWYYYQIDTKILKRELVKTDKNSILYTKATVGMAIQICNDGRLKGYPYIEWYQDSWEFGSYNFPSEVCTLKKQKFDNILEAVEFFDALETEEYPEELKQVINDSL